MRISDWSSDVCSSDLELAETDALARHVARAGIGRHDQDDVAEVDGLAVMIGQAAMVHDLQQYVEQVGMRLFDLVEQQHAMRILIDRVGRSEEHTSELQSLMRISYAVFCLNKKNKSTAQARLGLHGSAVEVENKL